MLAPTRLVSTLILIVATGILSSDRVLGFDQDLRPKITVSGSAEIKVKPDQAVLTFSVESREEKLDDAVKDNDSKIKSVVEFLKTSKLESKDIRTQVISIRPIFESSLVPWKGQAFQAPMAPANASVPRAPAGGKKPKLKPIGYTARRQLSIVVKDLEAFEAIYRGLIERGVNEVGGVQFETAKLREHRDEARLKAIRAAREKATAMAGELGAKLASVHSIVESTTPHWHSPLQNTVSFSGRAAASSDTLAAGLIEVKASVSVVFILGATELKPEPKPTGDQ